MECDVEFFFDGVDDVIVDDDVELDVWIVLVECGEWFVEVIECEVG